MKVSIILMDTDDYTVYTFDRQFPDSDGFHYGSSLRICPMCCRTWAKVILHERCEVYHLEPVSCRQCSWYSEHRHGIPGSLLEQGVHTRIDWGILPELPPDLLRREVEVTFSAWDKKPW